MRVTNPRIVGEAQGGTWPPNKGMKQTKPALRDGASRLIPGFYGLQGSGGGTEPPEGVVAKESSIRHVPPAGIGGQPDACGDFKWWARVEGSVRR
jgi:hypothetical protein